jgi:hypothetical protein
MQKMWRNYCLAWIFYACFLSVMMQTENILQGQFSIIGFLRILRDMLPAGVFLVVVWPISGYLERTKISTAKMVGAHLFFAIVFGAMQLCLMLIFKDGPSRRDFSWYMWPFLYNMMGYGIIASVFHGVRATAAARLQTIAINQAQNLLVAAELTALRHKLNPHFLFNTLHSIIALVRKDAKAAEAALFRFSDMLRYILDTEKSGSDRVTLDDELQFVRDYLDLESLRLGTRLQVTWDLDSKVTGVSLPALSIQPLVENSIKHAFNPRSQPGNLHIFSYYDEAKKRLEIIISDDGPGADVASIASATGMGIRTVERRLRLEYSDQAEFQIQTEPGAGFKVSFSIPTQAY